VLFTPIARASAARLRVIRYAAPVQKGVMRPDPMQQQTMDDRRCKKRSISSKQHATGNVG